MTENTESPQIFHIWAALSAVGACLGRRVWLPWGTGKMFANEYVLLVGNPGTRKSSAINLMQRQVAQATAVRFAPDDTAGQRQGLVEAMQVQAVDQKAVAEIESMVSGPTLSSISSFGGDEVLDALAKLDNMGGRGNVELEDRQCLYAVSSEFASFIGQNNHGMLAFLNKVYDAEPYRYQTAKGEKILEAPLLSIMSGTTPVDLNKSMPKEAAGQGFLSRVILVYGSQKARMVARPRPPADGAVQRVQERLRLCYNDLDGEVIETPAGYEYSIGLYGYAIDTSDSRFVYYQERRYSHLMKLAMVIAAASWEHGPLVIDKWHYEEAHQILRATELGMPDALGEFGLNPLSQVKQEIVEFLRSKHLKEPVTMAVILASFSRHAKQTDIQQCVADLVNSGQVVKNETLRDGHPESLFMGVTRKGSKDSEIVRLLQQTPGGIL